MLVVIESRVRFPNGFVLVLLSRILRIILRGRKSLNFILNILNLKYIKAYLAQKTFKSRWDGMIMNFMQVEMSLAKSPNKVCFTKIYVLSLLLGKTSLLCV